MDRHLTLPAAEEKRKQDVAAAAADKNKTTLDASEVDAAAAAAETETKDSKNVATFHGSSKQDYQGRSWHLCPRELTGRPDVSQSYPPKRWVRSYAGHSKGVSRIDLFPETGHLLLSASMDKTCKIWDVAKGRQLMTYAGHQQAVKDAAFSPDGSLFASVSFDKQIKVWDVERGTVVMEISKASAVPMARLRMIFREVTSGLLLVGLGGRKSAHRCRAIRRPSGGRDTSASGRQSRSDHALR